MPIRARAPSRMLVMNTSAPSISLYSCSRPSPCVRSSPTPRLPRLAASKNGFVRSPGRWITRMVRPASPPPAARSTLITSAPQSARIIAAEGAKVCSATSITRTPCITSYIGQRSRPGRSRRPGCTKARSAVQLRRLPGGEGRPDHLGAVLGADPPEQFDVDRRGGGQPLALGGAAGGDEELLAAAGRLDRQ